MTDRPPFANDGVYVIAEAGVNHNGDTERALELVDVAARCGADAVKFQAFTADRLVTKDARKADYQSEQLDEETSQWEMLKQYELSADQHRRLQRRCSERDITFLSTPFDVASADLLDELSVPLIKLGSGEVTNEPLLRHVASFGRPIVLSTGMSTLEEVRRALDWITDVDAECPVVALHCTSQYPASIDNVNLNVLQTMATELDVPIGYSDHTMAVETPALAVAAGAHVVEKHFTLDSSLPGPDHEASLEPPDLEAAVDLVRRTERMMGDPEKRPTRGEEETRSVVRKSLHAADCIGRGERFTEANIAVLRPTDGLEPYYYDEVVGRRASTTLEEGEPITAAVLEGRVR